MRKLIIGLVAGAILATTGIALASIPDSNGVIHGCRDNKSGDLRVIDTDAGQTCKSSETALTWNQTGPQGPQGDQGPAGPQGPAGLSNVHLVSYDKPWDGSYSNVTVSTYCRYDLGEVALSAYVYTFYPTDPQHPGGTQSGFVAVPLAPTNDKPRWALDAADVCVLLELGHELEVDQEASDKLYQELQRW
jgi:hypothetical protein